jgi:hypothetical protein
MTEHSATDLATNAAPEDERPQSPAYDADRSGPALAERYGIKPGMSKTRKILLGVFGFALLCGVAGYIAYNEANPQIQASVISYTANGDAITVTFQVDKSASQSVQCTLQAQDFQGNVIGTATVNVPGGPNGRAQQDMVYTVNTTGTPNTAIVSDCTATS